MPHPALSAFQAKPQTADFDRATNGKIAFSFSS
jgi:hypothetical protein